jgi:hypothetical protein
MFMHGGICISFQYVCFVFLWSVLSFWEVKVLFFYICGLGAALMHTGINYYYFNDAINTLAQMVF